MAIVATIAIAALAPGQIFAQQGAQCQAQLEASTVGGPVFYADEPIKIKLEMGAKEVTDFSGAPGYLDIKAFSYQMDCTEGDTWPGCNPAGNTVEFVANSVKTTCTADEVGGSLVTFDTQVIDQEIFFTVTDPDTIRNSSQQTCEVSFDILVTSLAGDNLEKEIVELTGFGGFDENNDAICSNGLPAGAAGSVKFDLSTITTNFLVTKTFSDDNPAPVDVHLKCYSGLILEQDFTITKDTFVSFVVRSYTPGDLRCEVTEAPVPGYEAIYEASKTSGVGDPSDDDDGCYYDNVVNGEYVCDITNELEASKVTVNKEWVDLVEGNDEIYLDAKAEWTCYNFRSDADGDLIPSFSGQLFFSGDSSDVIEDLYPDFKDLSWCEVAEVDVMQAVEADFSECEKLPVEIGGDNSCTIYNTVFFEGIPTLSQYGIALMAVLMLGVGMVGFRRFA